MKLMWFNLLTLVGLCFPLHNLPNKHIREFQEQKSMENQKSVDNFARNTTWLVTYAFETLTHLAAKNNISNKRLVVYITQYIQLISEVQKEPKKFLDYDFPKVALLYIPEEVLVSKLQSYYESFESTGRSPTYLSYEDDPKEHPKRNFIVNMANLIGKLLYNYSLNRSLSIDMTMAHYRSARDAIVESFLQDSERLFQMTSESLEKYLTERARTPNIQDLISQQLHQLSVTYNLTLDEIIETHAEELRYLTHNFDEESSEAENTPPQETYRKFRQKFANKIAEDFITFLSRKQLIDASSTERKKITEMEEIVLKKLRIEEEITKHYKTTESDERPEQDEETTEPYETTESDEIPVEEREELFEVGTEENAERYETTESVEIQTEERAEQDETVTEETTESREEQSEVTTETTKLNTEDHRIVVQYESASVKFNTFTRKKKKKTTTTPAAATTTTALKEQISSTTENEFEIYDGLKDDSLDYFMEHDASPDDPESSEEFGTSRTTTVETTTEYFPETTATNSNTRESYIEIITKATPRHPTLQPNTSSKGKPKSISNPNAKEVSIYQVLAETARRSYIETITKATPEHPTLQPNTSSKGKPLSISNPNAKEVSVYQVLTEFVTNNVTKIARALKLEKEDS